VGAFLAGVGLSSFPTSGLLRPHVSAVTDFFSSIFFVTLGALVGLPGLDELRLAAVLSVVVILATVPVVAAIAQRAGFARRPALEAGLVLAQTSELSLVVGLFGLMAGHVSQPVFTTIALVTIITMLLTPALLHERVVNRLLALYPVPPGAAPPPGGHVVIVGAGATGMPLVETVLADGLDVVVIDDDPEVVERLREADIPAIRGDAAQPHVLREAGVARARAISSTMRRPYDNRRLLQEAEGVPVVVRVFEESDAAWITIMGGTPVLYSEATAANLLRWFYGEQSRAEPADG
jgi:CPA2 family monovalent cation:H+ antiporter-2